MAATIMKHPPHTVPQGAASGGLDLFEPVQAPWIRPGVVVHDPTETIDGLLADFALNLKSRGFNVLGYVQRNNRGCSGASDGCAERIDGFDLGTSESVTMARGSAEQYLRHAMRENADLLVISRFSASVEATEAAKALVGTEASQGMPLLTSIAGGCIHKWHHFAQHDGAMIAPNARALWNWWGPERLYRDLALGVGNDDTVQIAVGARWLMVEGRHGSGLAYLPRHPRDLQPRLPKLARQSLRELAALAFSWDPVETALGIAAINAYYNRADGEAAVGNGVRVFRSVSGRVVVIGAFPGVDDILPNCAVIETSPRPGEYPTVAMDTLLPGCGAAVINSSALINRNLPRILRLAQGRRAALIGPSTPLTPRLHDYGIEVLGGLSVTDPKGLAAAIRAGALPREFGRFGRFVHLRRPLDFGGA
jgi:uncharacterized protein